MAFANRLAILVGGLGGLGCATGKALQENGAHLALLYAPFEAGNLESVITEVYGFPSIEAAGDKIKGYECDITDAASVEKAFAAIAHDDTAPPSILVNTAGYVNLTPFEDTPPADALKHYMVNLYGPTLTSQAFGKLYIERRKKDGDSPAGRIVNIASQAAHVALLNHGPYCASKAGLIGLTKCIASEWGTHGITANTISPGPIMTEMGKKAWADKGAREAYLKQVPTEKFAEPEEVARIVVFLCEDSANSITGADIRLDGGYTVR